MAKPYLEGRISYCKDWYGEGECFLFQTKWSDEPETAWGLDTAFYLLNPDGEKMKIAHGDGEWLSYQALTKIREWLKLGVHIYFGREIECPKKEV